MIDSNEYCMSYQLHKPEYTHDTLIGTDFTENPDLMDEHLHLCIDRVPAFSLTTKTWGFFKVNRIDDIEFNSTAFENLALEQDKKDMIAALVRSGQGSETNYDDMIKGKGKGIIFLLHGPSGMGKTFTAGQHSFVSQCLRV
jgi:hypothetical protein